MKLYHGTMTASVESIMPDGLRPRGNEPSHDLPAEKLVEARRMGWQKTTEMKIAL